MPQGPPELHEKWQSDENACNYLKDHGYTMTRSFGWLRPSKDHHPTEEEFEALEYLVLEWDYGYLEDLD